MKTKVCTTCKEEKPLSDFYFKNKKKGTRAAYCSFCQREYSRKEYQRQANKYRKRARVNNKKRLEQINDLIRETKNQPCMDCGEVHPYWAMDFDHRDGKKKEFGISAGRNYSVSRIKKEITKCDVVCALCHRYRTHGEQRTKADVAQGI